MREQDFDSRTILTITFTEATPLYVEGSDSSTRIAWAGKIAKGVVGKHPDDVLHEHVPVVFIIEEGRQTGEFIFYGSLEESRASISSLQYEFTARSSEPIVLFDLVDESPAQIPPGDHRFILLPHPTDEKAGVFVRLVGEHGKDCKHGLGADLSHLWMQGVALPPEVMAHLSGEPATK